MRLLSKVATATVRYIPGAQDTRWPSPVQCDVTLSPSRRPPARIGDNSERPGPQSRCGLGPQQPGRTMKVESTWLAWRDARPGNGYSLWVPHTRAGKCPSACREVPEWWAPLGREAVSWRRKSNTLLLKAFMPSSALMQGGGGGAEGGFASWRQRHPRYLQSIQ